MIKYKLKNEPEVNEVELSLEMDGVDVLLIARRGDLRQRVMRFDPSGTFRRPGIVRELGLERDSRDRIKEAE